MNKTVLHWSYRDYEQVPIDLLYYDEDLEELYLKENFIRTIPLWMCQLAQLKFIQLSGNLIEFIPDCIHELIHLEFLDLSGNQIVNCPPSLGELSQLQSLNLSGNRIENVPKSLCSLKKLEFLDLSDNLITKLPIELSECTRLSNLVLNDNPLLLHVPERIMNMSSLQSFSANRCGFMYLPAIANKFINNVQMFHNTTVKHVPMVFEKFFSSFFFDGTQSATTYYNNGQQDKDKEADNKKYADNPHYFTVKEKESGTILLLPFGTRKIFSLDGPDNQVTLYDDCLHVINYINLYLNFYKYQPFLQILPSKAMGDHITNGPIARCTNKECLVVLYTSYYLAVCKKTLSSCKMLFSCFFCSKFCGFSWLSANKGKYIPIAWEICDN